MTNYQEQLSALGLAADNELKDAHHSIKVHEEFNDGLETQIAELHGELALTDAAFAAVNQQLTEAKARIAELEGLPAPVPTNVFRDDFTSLDTSRWSVYNNTYGEGNNELQGNVPSAVTADGALSITARKEKVTLNGKVRNYTSGFIGSREAGKYYPLYGRYEVRAKLPDGQGLWPAFWLRHRNGSSVAEVDVLEYFANQVPGKITQTLHFPNSIGYNVHKKSTPVDLTKWHTYAVDISQSGSGVMFKFFVDDVLTTQYLNTKSSAFTNVDKNAAWDVAINMAVGGNWVGDPEGPLGLMGNGKCGLTGKVPPPGTSCPTTGIKRAVLPASYLVDYVITPPVV